MSSLRAARKMIVDPFKRASPARLDERECANTLETKLRRNYIFGSYEMASTYFTDER